MEDILKIKHVLKSEPMIRFYDSQHANVPRQVAQLVIRTLLACISGFEYLGTRFINVHRCDVDRNLTVHVWRTDSFNIDKILLSVSNAHLKMVRVICDNLHA